MLPLKIEIEACQNRFLSFRFWEERDFEKMLISQFTCMFVYQMINKDKVQTFKLANATGSVLVGIYFVWNRGKLFNTTANVLSSILNSHTILVRCQTKLNKYHYNSDIRHFAIFTHKRLLNVSADISLQQEKQQKRDQQSDSSSNNKNAFITNSLQLFVNLKITIYCNQGV